MIWLIGNKGMLGSDVAAALVKTGADFISSGREVDISDRRAAEKFLASARPEWIINAAAYTDVDGAEGDKETVFRVNAEAVKNLAEVAFSRGAGFVHISTDYVFDGKNKLGYSEDDETSPLNVYGESKLKGEFYIRDILDSHYIIRTSWLYGARGKNFVLTMMNLLGQKEEIKVVSDQIGSPTYSADLAGALINIISRNEPKFGTYHFSNGASCNWYEFACAIYERGREMGLLKKEVNIVSVDTSEFPRPARRPAYSLLIKDKIKRELGINIRDWKEALGDFMRSFALSKSGQGSFAHGS